MSVTADRCTPVKILMQAAPSKGRWEVWNDWITLAACAYAMAGGDQPEVRVEELRRINERYRLEEIEELDRAFTAYIDEINGNPFQDFLGTMYMEMDFGQSEIGQFFTPFHLTQLMSDLAHESISERVREKGYTSVYDPACGGGATLIAAAEKLYNDGFNPQRCCWFEGQDVSRLTALMCYVQLCALGLPGRVIIGNTLGMERRETFVTPNGCDPVWRFRGFGGDA